VPKIVAVMQPYFFPYAGYFSLIESVDHFVMFDCVQFPRRGWVHRNRVPGPKGQEEWLTIPLRHQSRDVRIRDLLFADGAERKIAHQLKRYPWFSLAEGEAGDFIRRALLGPLCCPVEMLASSLRVSADLLGLQREFTFSSDLNLDPALKGQDRVIAAVKAVNGTGYVNLSGGTALYAREAFDRQGLQLYFLSPYVGSHWSMLYRLATENLGVIVREVMANANPTLA
jgi:hypothetical protein